MVKRFLDCRASDFKEMSKKDLLSAIHASEGRVMVSEAIGAVQPVLMTITNAEFAAAFGADIILLNLFDVNNPCLNGLPGNIEPENIIHKLKELTGRLIGLNLEPVDPSYGKSQDLIWGMQPGRLATIANARKALAMGVNMLVLTGNPCNGVSNLAITNSLREINGLGCR